MIFKTIIDFIYPPRCPVCDGISDGICRECKKTLIYIREAYCLVCGKPLINEQEEYCSDCKKKPHFFDQGRALFSYQGRIRSSLYRLKYANRREYADTYGAELALAMDSWIKSRGISCIVPMPLHRTRAKSRGYNQAALIARALGRRLSLPVEERLLYRVKKTVPLKLLSGPERRATLKGAFAVKAEIFPGETILLVDDIYTTGSTLNAAAACLKEAGAGRIFVLCVATGG